MNFYTGKSRKTLGMGMRPILKTRTHIQNSDLVGFILRHIPMKPRFGGYRGYEKMGVGYGSQTHIYSANIEILIKKNKILKSIFDPFRSHFD